MSHPAHQQWSVEQFFEWQAQQTERFELVAGAPVRLMTGAKNLHGDIVVNLIADLRTQLRGSKCRPFTGDGSIETLPGQIRRPDVGIDCGPRDPNALKASEPRLVIEVLSPATRDFDAFEKLAEYKQVDCLEYLLLVETNAPEMVVYARDNARAWVRTKVEGLDRQVQLPVISVTLALSEVYDGVVFPLGPRLVKPQNA